MIVMIKGISLVLCGAGICSIVSVVVKDLYNRIVNRVCCIEIILKDSWM